VKQINIEHYKSPYGELILGSFDGKLCLCDWRYRKMRNAIDNRIKKGLKAEYLKHSDVVLEEARLQLEEYFSYKRKTFNIPLLMQGTEFQIKVWNGLIKIPYGETSSYLGLAKNIANSKSVRAVANANGANAISIFIPCHRIIGSNGKLVGYAGGLKAKAKLLNLEHDLFA